MRQATLLFLIEDQQILLAMKKRGFGVGRWNGVGGKPNANETIKDTAIRECKEEIEVTPTVMSEVATLNFYSPDEKSNQQVIVYLCTSWEGIAKETEEMSPKWFSIDQIPYDEMWPDDKFWLPKVIAGQYVSGDFHFDENDNLVEHSLKT